VRSVKDSATDCKHTQQSVNIGRNRLPVKRGNTPAGVQSLKNSCGSWNVLKISSNVVKNRTSQ